MMQRPGWGTAASIFNWAAGITTILSGVSTIFVAATTMDMLNQLSALVVDDAAGLGSISMAIPIILGILALIIGGLGITCGYGLWAMYNWARITAAIVHGIFGLLYLIGMMMLISMNLVGASILVLFLFGINIMFLVGLLLRSTADGYAGDSAGGMHETRLATDAHYGGGMGGYNLPPTQSATQAMGATGGAVRIPATETATASSGMANMGSYAQPGSVGRAIKKTEVANAEPPVLAWIIERNGIRKGREHRLRAEGVTIGRDPNHCEIVIDESKVSARHAHIKLEHGQFVIYDLASTNRTFVNDKETQKHVLRDNDQIRIGPNVVLSFVHVKR